MFQKMSGRRPRIFLKIVVVNFLVIVVMNKLNTRGGFDPQLGGFFGPSKNPQPPNFKLSTPDFFNLK